MAIDSRKNEGPPPDRAALRQRVDEIDAALLQLLARRCQLTRGIGRLKRADGLPIRAPGREDEVLAHHRRIGEQLGLPGRWVRRFSRLVLALGVASQRSSSR